MQVAGIKHYELRSGRAKGTEAFDICTSAGLASTMVRNCALDIAWASYEGTVLSSITPNDTVASAFFESQGNGFLHGFYAGLLTTCGPSYISVPCEDDGETLGLHGRLAATPAEEVGYRIERANDSIGFVTSGKVRETQLFGKNLTLERTVRCRYDESVMRVEDRVTNHGFTRQPLQILCHFNYGWPLLSPQAEILLLAKSITPRTPHMVGELANHLEICTPQLGFDEQVYYFTSNSDGQGMSRVALVNAELGWGIYEKFDIMQLPDFIQWKNLGAGGYVIGLEVGNSFLDGHDKERAQGRLPFIEPEETKKYCFELGIVDGDAEVSALKAETADYRQLTVIRTSGSVSGPGAGYVLC